MKKLLDEFHIHYLYGILGRTLQTFAALVIKWELKAGDREMK